MECEAGRRIPLNFCLQYESEAELAKLPLFEGKQLFRCLSLRVLGRCLRGIGLLHEKLKAWKDWKRAGEKPEENSFPKARLS
jgi:hypothetical protein